MTIFRRRSLLASYSVVARSVAACSVLSVALCAQRPAPTQLAPGADTANPTPVPTRAIFPSGVALSPDGTALTYSVGGRLHVVRLEDKTETVLAPSGPQGCSSSDPAWSPDSKTLAFTSTCYGPEKTDQEEIVLWSKATGEFKQLTHLKGNLEQLAWSPDGKSIAFLFVENATRSAGALDAMKPFAGVIGEDGLEVQGVYAVDVASSKTNWITDLRKMRLPYQSLHVFEFAWAPNSLSVTYVAAAVPGENNWWVAKLYKQSVGVIAVCEWFDGHVAACKDDGPPMGAPEVILDPTTVAGPLHGLQIAVPRYSPDGKQIAFIGGLMSDQGSTGGDVWVVPATGGAPVDVTPEIDGTPTFEAWTGKDSVGFVEDRRGHILFNDVSVSGHKQFSTTDLGEVNVGGGAIKNAVSLSTNGLLAFVKSGYNAPPEVFVMNGRTNALTQITHLNAGAKAAATKFESVEWENGGFHVQGWLTYPKDYNPGKRYPLIVEVHGGPSASAGPRANTMFSDAGYFVLAPNPRGSFGQGERFVQANVKDFGYGDLKDIEAGMDAIEARLPIDTHREGLTGWSYGGFMTMFAVTQTHRFKAAVAGAGISDWLSYYGENSIDQWMTPFFGASVYDDPAVYAKSSAITYIKNVKTPTLVIVGDRDGECPAPQSFEFWHALRAEGVKTQLVVYPNEGHGFRDPVHIRDRSARTLRWFAENMPEGKE